jgi:hypothetical protein
VNGNAGRTALRNEQHARETAVLVTICVSGTIITIAGSQAPVFRAAT